MAFGIDDAIAAVSGLIDKALDFIPNPQERQRAEAALRANAMQFTQQLTMAQLDVNKEEAKSQSIFVAGWRPFIGWVGGSALVYHYIVRPLLPWTLTVFGVHGVPELPTLDESLVEIVAAMLGIGGLRTYEKINGVASPTATSPVPPAPVRR